MLKSSSWVALVGLLGCPAVAAAQVKAPAQQTSTEADRKAVSITVYNQNFGVVREVRELPTP